MSSSKYVKTERCKDVLEIFCKENQVCTFFTLTTPDVVDIYEIRERWRNFRHYLVELLGKDTKYIMNYELHPNGHGWHIHSVWNTYIPLKTHYHKLRNFGFGRVDVQLVNSVGVAEYLSKHALKAYRGVSSKELESNAKFRLRLVNMSRGLPRLSDYYFTSDFLEKARQLLKVKYKKEDFNILNFREKFLLCEISMIMPKDQYLNLESMYMRRKKLKLDYQTLRNAGFGSECPAIIV